MLKSSGEWLWCCRRRSGEVKLLNVGRVRSHMTSPSLIVGPCFGTSFFALLCAFIARMSSFC